MTTFYATSVGLRDLHGALCHEPWQERIIRHLKAAYVHGDIEAEELERQVDDVLRGRVKPPPDLGLVERR